jgi:hypothetical protein
MNRTVVATITVAFVILIASYLAIGGAFDQSFWHEALPGLMENLAIAALAAFVFDSIIKKQRQTKYKDANAKLSQSVLLQANLFAYALLEYFGLIDQSQIPKGDLNFECAYERLKSADISGRFLAEVLRLSPEEKPDYIAKFATLLETRTKPLVETLEKVYPRPDSALTRDWESVHAAIEATSMLPKTVLEANMQVEAKDRLTSEQLNLVIKVGHPFADRKLKTLKAGLVQLSDRARKNDLFVSFD